jgi:hypothetical protein
MAAGHDSPRVGRTYRCSVCRLELTLDEPTGRLTVAPVAADETPPKTDSNGK